MRINLKMFLLVFGVASQLVLGPVSTALAARPSQICDGFMAEIGGLADLGRLAKRPEIPSSADEVKTPAVTTPTEPTRIGELLPTFRHDKHYDVELKQTDIKDQCSLGTCHIYSFLSEMEQGFLSRTGKPIKLSEEYVVYQHWFMRVMSALGELSPSVEIKFGAYPSQTLFLFRTVGMMPEGAWKPKINYQKNPLAGRLVEYMENSMARAVEKAKNSPDTLEAKQAVLEQELKDILTMLQEAVGDVPETFEYEGVTYNPKTFAEAYFPEIFEPWVRLQVAEQKWNVVDGKGTTKPMITDEMGWISTYEANMDTVENYVKARLDKGENVFLAYEHQDAYVDMKTGIMAIEAFKAPKNGKVLPRPMRDAYNRGAGGHAVQVVAYETDPATGRVKKWKIKNSWGVKAGDEGYFHMYSSYFRSFVFEVLIKNDGEFTDKMPKSEESEPKAEEQNADGEPAKVQFRPWWLPKWLPVDWFNVKDESKDELPPGPIKKLPAPAPKPKKPNLPK